VAFILTNVDIHSIYARPHRSVPSRPFFALTLLFRLPANLLKPLIVSRFGSAGLLSCRARSPAVGYRLLLGSDGGINRQRRRPILKA
jgi:hypothetical protein